MPIVNGLCTLEEAKASIWNGNTVPAGVDADLEAYISAATPLIEDMVGPVYARSETVLLDGGRSVLALPFISKQPRR